MKYIARIALSTALLFAVGCASTAPLPKGAKPVGGGFSIEWEAPVDGTAILVEKTSNAIVATKTLESGDDFEFEIDPESDAFQTLFPGSTKAGAKPRFVLYFVPSPATPVDFVGTLVPPAL